MEKRAVSDEAIDHAVQIGKRISKQEFDNFLKDKEAARLRYETIIRFLASNPGSIWSAIKRRLELKEGRRVNDRTINSMLSALSNSGFILKDTESYRVAE